MRDQSEIVQRRDAMQRAHEMTRNDFIKAYLEALNWVLISGGEE